MIHYLCRTLYILPIYFWPIMRPHHPSPISPLIQAEQIGTWRWQKPKHIVQNKVYLHKINCCVDGPPIYLNTREDKGRHVQWRNEEAVPKACCYKEQWTVDVGSVWSGQCIAGIPSGGREQCAEFDNAHLEQCAGNWHIQANGYRAYKLTRYSLYKVDCV
jgi:hypothetical protein